MTASMKINVVDLDGRARTNPLHAVSLSRVRDSEPSWDYEKFRTYILTSAANAGLTVDTVADLARAADIPRAPISKWFRGLEQPGVPNLRKLAVAIQVPLPDLLVLAGRSNSIEMSLAAEPVAVELADPLARRIEHLLAPDSPIPADEKARYRSALELLTDAQERWVPRRKRA